MTFTRPQMQTQANIFKYVLLSNSPNNPRTDQNTLNTKLQTHMVCDKGTTVPYTVEYQYNEILGTSEINML